MSLLLYCFCEAAANRRKAGQTQDGFPFCRKRPFARTLYALLWTIFADFTTKTNCAILNRGGSLTDKQFPSISIHHSKGHTDYGTSDLFLRQQQRGEQFFDTKSKHENFGGYRHQREKNRGKPCGVRPFVRGAGRHRADP